MTYEGELKFEEWLDWKPIFIDTDNAIIRFGGHDITEYDSLTVLSWVMDHVRKGTLKIDRVGHSDTMGPKMWVKKFDYA